MQIILVSILVFTPAASIVISDDSFEHELCSLEGHGPMDSAWYTFSHDNRHTGQSPYNTRDNPMHVKWKFEAEILGFTGSPVIDKNGVLYLPAEDSYLYALNPDGSVLWQFKINDWGTDSPALAEDGTIYIGSLDNYLYAINPNGTLKWRFNAQDNIIQSSPTIGADGTVYFGICGPGYDIGRVYAVNPDGTEKWHQDVGDYVYSTAAIGEDGTVYITSNDQYLYALDPDDGSVIWKYRTGAGGPSIGDDGTIYVPSHDHYLYAVNPDGTLQWKTEIGTGSSDTPAIGEDGTIYIGELYFYAVNPNGTIKWIYEGWDKYDYQVTSSAYAISADGLVYFVATNGSGRGGDLFALNCDDGSLRLQKTIAPVDYQYSQPVIGSDGTVYVGSEFFGGSTDGYFYAFGSVEGNHPPETPDIDGPVTGKTQEEQTYTFTINDVDNDKVFLFVDWGDGSDTGWSGPYTSGEEITLAHTWNWKGTYTMKAKGMDEHEIEGGWAYLEVVMPKYKMMDSLLNCFFEMQKGVFNIWEFVLR